MASKVVLEILSKATQALDPLNIPCALFGGLALAVWSYPRATRDVDLLIGIDRSGIEPVIEALRAIGCRLKGDTKLNRVGDHCFVHLLYTPIDEFYDVQFDLLLAETDIEKSAIARSVVRTIPGIERPIRVLNCDDLILFKLASGRVIDFADASMLLRENRDQLDWPYFMRWNDKLNLSREFQQVWCEAFPGEDAPK